MALGEARKGEVALKLLGQMLEDKGLKLNKETRNKICDTARRAGVPPREAIEVIECLTRDNLYKAFTGIARQDTGMARQETRPLTGVVTFF